MLSNKVNEHIGFYRFPVIVFLLIAFAFATATAISAQNQKSETPAAADVAPATYRLRQGDKLSVKFMYHTELNENSVTVRPDGFINLQLIDDVPAEGLTVAALKSRLEKKYDEILINPVISVALLEFVTPRVFVGGQVAKPGRYDLREAHTLIEVIFVAGGFTADANRRSVLHARPDGKGDWTIQSTNVLDIINRKKGRADFDLRDGDYIFVPDSKLSRVNKAIQTFRGLLPSFLY